MNQKEKSVAEKLITSKMNDLINGVNRAIILKRNDLKEQFKKKKGIDKLGANVEKTRKAYEEAVKLYNEAISKASGEFKDFSTEFEEMAVEISQNLKEKKTKLISDLWLGDVSEEAKKTLSEIPTLTEFFNNGGKVLSVGKQTLQLVQKEQYENWEAFSSDYARTNRVSEL